MQRDPALQAFADRSFGVYQDEVQDIVWNLQVNHGHSVRLTTFTVRVTYYALR